MKHWETADREYWARSVYDARDRRRTPGPETRIVGGYERRLPSCGYYWDGQRRGGDPAHPFLVFQYTLSGCGIYREEGVSHKVDSGTAFIAAIPSSHVYYLPEESEHWSFLYLVLTQPYVVQRIAEGKKAAGSVFAMPGDGALLTRFLAAFETVNTTGYRDVFAEDQASYELLVEYERAAHHAAYPRPAREKLLDETRAFALAQLPTAADVTQLAEMRNMSRSRFSHHFRAATGLAPAGYLRQIRLEEASRLLIHSDLKLESVAAATGFANANDLCKVFRRYFHRTPGEFRRQMQGG